jgi:hypothetical protein
MPNTLLQNIAVICGDRQKSERYIAALSLEDALLLVTTEKFMIPTYKT